MSEMKLWKCEKCDAKKPCYAHSFGGAYVPDGCLLKTMESSGYKPDWQPCTTHKIVEEKCHRCGSDKHLVYVSCCGKLACLNCVVDFGDSFICRECGKDFVTKEVKVEQEQQVKGWNTIKEAEHALLHPNGMTDECGKLVEVEQPGPALEIEQSCGNCFHFAKCRSLGITDSADRTECDFTPSRWKEPTTFTPKPEPQEQSEQEITTEEYARYALKFIGELQQQIDELSERIKKLEEI